MTKQYQDVEIPARVVFLNIKDSKIFFDCSPAEARMAKKEIERYRREGVTIEALKLKKFLIMDLIKNKNIKQSEIINNTNLDHITLDGINKRMVELEKENRFVEWMVVNASTYGKIRMFGMTVIDVECDADILRETGVLAKLWSMRIILDNTIKGEDYYLGSEYRDGQQADPYVLYCPNLFYKTYS